MGSERLTPARRRGDDDRRVAVARGAVDLFFDASGHRDFGPKGTRDFCVGTRAPCDPAALERALGAPRYELLAEGGEPEAFHAPEDRQAARGRVFAAMAAVGGSVVDALVGDEAQAPEHLRDGARFYPECAAPLCAPIFALLRVPRRPARARSGARTGLCARLGRGLSLAAAVLGAQRTARGYRRAPPRW